MVLFCQKNTMKSEVEIILQASKKNSLEVNVEKKLNVSPLHETKFSSKVIMHGYHFVENILRNSCNN
jgi:hypothetical protein